MRHNAARPGDHLGEDPVGGNAGHRGPQHAQLGRAGWSVAALIALTLLVTSCSQGDSKSPGTAIAGSGAVGSSSSSGTTKPSALAYSQCMRAHGIKDFPDPGSDGDIQLNAGPDSDLSGPKFQAADSACKSLLPNHAVAPANLKAASLKYAKCMRANGIADFPDPKADGRLQLQATPGGDLDPNNPTFKSANDACKQYLPAGSGDASLNTGGGS